MSVEAIVWALNADVPDPVAKLVLIGLANHARADGGAAWPSKALLARYARVSTRTIVTKLQTLQDLGFIELGDQRLVAYMRADRRPNVYDLQLVRGENLAPREDDYELHLRGENPAPRSGHGVKSVQPRGEAAVSPEPSLEVTTTEDSLRSSSAQPVDNSAQTLVAEWVDHCNGGRPPGRVIGQVAKELGAMLTEGIPYADVRAGLQQWHTQGLHPSTLASVVHEIRNPKKANGAKHLQPAEDARSVRLRSTPDPIPPPDLTPAETNRWLRDARRRIAAGEKP